MDPRLCVKKKKNQVSSIHEKNTANERISRFRFFPRLLSSNLEREVLTKLLFRSLQSTVKHLLPGYVRHTCVKIEVLFLHEKTYTTKIVGVAHDWYIEENDASKRSLKYVITTF